MTERIAAAGALIAAARLSRTPLGVLPEEIRPRDGAESYAVQDAVHDRLASTSIGPRIGYKIGCTTAVMQAYLGLQHPCSAGIFAGVVHPAGATIRSVDYRRVGVECEIAVRLARDVLPGEGPFTADVLRNVVASYMAAIEIVDDRYVDWRATDAATLIADDYFAAGCALGAEVPAAAVGDPAALVGTTVINGAVVGEGRGSDVLGSPLNALAWLAENLAMRGQWMRQGEVVLTGSLVETKWLARGDRVTVSVSGLGSVELAVD